MLHFNPEVIRDLKQDRSHCLYADVSHADSLEHAHIERARFIILAISAILLRGPATIFLRPRSSRDTCTGMSFQRDLKRSDTEIVRLEITEYKGEHYLNIRIWYLDKDGEWKPTKKGVAIRPSQFSDFKKFVLEAEQELQKS